MFRDVVFSEDEVSSLNNNILEIRDLELHTLDVPDRLAREINARYLRKIARRNKTVLNASGQDAIHNTNRPKQLRDALQILSEADSIDFNFGVITYYN